MEILNFCFYVMAYHFAFLNFRKKNGGHHTNYLSGGPNLPPPPHISRLIQYKMLRSVICCHLYTSILLL